MDTEEPTGIPRPHWGWFLLLDGSLALLVLIVIFPSKTARIRGRTPLFSKKLLRFTLLAAFALHLGEGASAWVQAGQKGLPKGPWATQTAIVGFPSLRLLAGQDSRNSEIFTDHRPQKAEKQA